LSHCEHLLWLIEIEFFGCQMMLLRFMYCSKRWLIMCLHALRPPQILLWEMKRLFLVKCQSWLSRGVVDHSLKQPGCLLTLFVVRGGSLS
jgi:hypothetical protein